MTDNPYKDANRYGKDYLDRLFAGQRDRSAKAGGYYCGALLGAGVCVHGIVGAVSALHPSDKREVNWKSVALRTGETVLGAVGFVASLSKASGILARGR
jgi:hypothetical protein